MGTLSEKFPGLANSVVAALREFLVHPSPILDRLNRHSQTRSPRSPMRSVTTNTDYSKGAVVNKITEAFDQLRDIAMKSVCRLVNSVHHYMKGAANV